MDDQPVLLKIKSNYNSYSDKERLIADYILDTPEKIIHNTINQVADDLNVADSTVFRFCQKVGYKGYQSLKLSIAAEAITPIKDIHEQIELGDSTMTIVEKVFQTNAQTLTDTLEVCNSAAFNQAIDLLSQASSIEFFGSGGSNVVALDAYHKFIKSGLTVTYNADSHMQLMSASQLTKNDVAIVISHSGSTKDMIDIVETLKENSVPVITITNFVKSKLSENGTVNLPTLSSETSFRSEAMSSRIAQLTIIDALFTNLMIKNEQKAKQALTKMRQAIAKKKI